jgi:hypothetical protein
MRQRQRNRRPIFLVRWVGFPDEAEWTWEPAEHIKHTEAFTRCTGGDSAKPDHTEKLTGLLVHGLDERWNQCLSVPNVPPPRTCSPVRHSIHGPAHSGQLRSYEGSSARRLDAPREADNNGLIQQL